MPISDYRSFQTYDVTVTSFVAIMVSKYQKIDRASKV